MGSKTALSIAGLLAIAIAGWLLWQDRGAPAPGAQSTAQTSPATADLTAPSSMTTATRW